MTIHRLITAVVWSHVSLMLTCFIAVYTGTLGDSDTHMLASRDYRVCQRGDVTVFLLRYDYDVGEVKSVRLWHDSSGDSPAWLVN